MFLSFLMKIHLTENIWHVYPIIPYDHQICQHLILLKEHHYMLNKCGSFALLKRNQLNVPLPLSSSGWICHNLHKNSRTETRLWSIYRNYPEEDRNLVAPLSDDLMIFYYTAQYCCPVVCSTRWCTVAPTSHSLGQCEYSPNAGLNFHAHTVWECFHSSVGLWLDWLLDAVPTRFSIKNARPWNVSHRQSASHTLCAHCAVEHTLFI